MYVSVTDSGQSPADAELNYVENAKKLAMYGVHLHDAKVGLLVYQIQSNQIYCDK